jgi:signal transduction histidine kinase
LPEEDFYILVFEDKTTETQFERYLIETSKSSEIGIISSSIAHEINNPLAGIISYLQLIENDVNCPQVVKSDINELLDSAHSCKDTVERLLSYSRTNIQNEKKINISLVEIIKDAIEITKIKNKFLRILFKFNIQESEVFYHVQKNELTHAFCHIFDNCVEAITEKINCGDLVQGKIEISILTNNNHIEVQIIDNGIGIEKKNLPLVSSPLYSTKKLNNHIGLGLTIATEVIFKNNGTVNIYSQTKEGTSLIITFKRPE